MLAIHWSPIRNKENIIEEGIKIKNGKVFCFPLTQHNLLNRWWPDFLNTSSNRPKEAYIGFIFKITKEDFPLQFGHLVNSNESPTIINSIEDLKKEFNEKIIFRIGEHISYEKNKMHVFNENFLETGKRYLKEHPNDFDKFYQDEDFLMYTFEDYEIVINSPINSDRIIKIIPY